MQIISLGKAQHEEVGKDDKQYRETVDGRYLRLCKMLAVQGHQQAGRDGQPGLFGQLFTEQVHSGKHQNPGKRSGETPAEGRHAENGYRQTDQYFAKRRM